MLTRCIEWYYDQILDIWNPRRGRFRGWLEVDNKEVLAIIDTVGFNFAREVFMENRADIARWSTIKLYPSTSVGVKLRIECPELNYFAQIKNTPTFT